MKPVLILLDVKLEKGANAWRTSQKLMGNPENFIRMLKDYDKDNIKLAKWKKIAPYARDPEL